MGYSEEIKLREKILKNVFDWKASVRMSLIDTYRIDELTEVSFLNTGYRNIDERSARTAVTVLRNPSDLAEYFDDGKTFEFIDAGAMIDIYCNIRNYVGLFASQLTTALRENIDFLSPSSSDYEVLSEMLDDIKKFIQFANFIGARINKGYEKLDERLLPYVQYQDNSRRISRVQLQREEVDLKFLFQDFLPPEYRTFVSPWFGGV